MLFTACENNRQSKKIITEPFTPSKLTVKAVGPDLIFVGTDREILYINAKSLEVLWSKALPSMHNVYCIDKNKTVFIFSTHFPEDVINKLSIINLDNATLNTKAFNTELSYQYAKCFTLGESIILTDNDSFIKFNKTAGEIEKSGALLPDSLGFNLLQQLESSLDNHGTLIWKEDIVIYETDSFKIVSGSKGRALKNVSDKQIQWELHFDSKINLIDINTNYLVFWFYKNGTRNLGVLNFRKGKLILDKEIPIDFRVHIEDKFLVLIESMKKVEIFSLPEKNLILNSKSKIIEGNYLDAITTENNLVLFENTGQLISMPLDDL